MSTFSAVLGDVVAAFPDEKLSPFLTSVLICRALFNEAKPVTHLLVGRELFARAMDDEKFVQVFEQFPPFLAMMGGVAHGMLFGMVVVEVPVDAYFALHFDPKWAVTHEI